MALANCKSCGRLFDNRLRDVCPVCIKEEDEKFHIVREYLKEHRHASTYEVSEATDVETTLIIKFIREGRLALENSPNMNYPCDSCGTAIQEGKYCRPCKDRLNKSLGDAKSELEQGQSQKTERGDYFSKRLR